MFEPSAEINDLAHRVVDSAFQVHKLLGPGFLESVYHEALAVELQLRAIPFVREKSIRVLYKGYAIGRGVLDFLIDDKLVVEIKTVEVFGPIHTAQVISYLKMTKLPLALLITFNVPEMRRGIRRVVQSAEV